MVTAGIVVTIYKYLCLACSRHTTASWVLRPCFLCRCISLRVLYGWITLAICKSSRILVFPIHHRLWETA